MNISLSPTKFSPPANTVGVAMVMDGSIKHFKFALHSILNFTDHPYMVTVAESVQDLPIRKYLNAVKHNHPVNVLMHDDPISVDEQYNFALRYMFNNPGVRFGAVLMPSVIVEPMWLGKIISRLMSIDAVNNKLGIVQAISPCQQDSVVDLVVFKRDAYEKVGSYTKDFSRIARENHQIASELSPGILSHKLTGGKP